MSETRTVYNPEGEHIITLQDPSPEGESPNESTFAFSGLPSIATGAIYNADGQIKNLLNIASVNEDRSTGALISGFLLLHKDLDRIATALEMRNRADTADRPLSRRLRAVNGGAKP